MYAHMLWYANGQPSGNHMLDLKEHHTRDGVDIMIWCTILVVVIIMIITPTAPSATMTLLTPELAVLPY